MSSVFPEQLALEKERDFLLDSIEELDREHVSGALDDREYVSLRDQHVVRAAAVLRTLSITKKQPVTSQAKAKKVASWLNIRQRRLWMLGIGALVAISVAGIFQVVSSRDDGQITGDVASSSVALLQQAQTQTASGKAADAVKTYDKVLKLDPNNVQALTYRGWLLNLAGLHDEGYAYIQRAIDVQPSFADPHFFKGYILLNSKNDPNGAIAEFNTFLASNPPQEMISLVQHALEDAKARAAIAK